MHAKILSFAFTLFFSTQALATALSKSVLIGPKATGMGGAFVAIADDPSAIFHNPAGMVQIESRQFLLGMDSLITDLDYTPPAGTTESAKTEFIPVPHVFAVSNDFKPIALGLGLYFPHGNGGKFSAASAVVSNPLEGRIFSMEITPTVAWQILDGLSVGAGLRIVRISEEIKGQALLLDPSDPTSLASIDDLDVSGWDLGASAGLLYRHSPLFRVGAAYRSKISKNLSGDVQLTSAAGTLNTDVKLSQSLPTIITGGIASEILEGLTLSTQYSYERNSEIKVINATVTGVGALSLPQNYKDSHTLHFGAEYWFLPEVIAARVGYARDLQASVPDTAQNRVVGDIASNEISVGGTYQYKNYNLGLTWNARFGERDIPVTATNPGPGNYDAFVHSIVLGFGFNL